MKTRNIHREWRMDKGNNGRNNSAIEHDGAERVERERDGNETNTRR